MELLIDKVTSAPRKLLKLDAGTVEEGNLADLTVLDPNAEWTFNSKSNKSKSINSPYWNQLLKGKAFAVFNNGQYQINNA